MHRLQKSPLASIGLLLTLAISLELAPHAHAAELLKIKLESPGEAPRTDALISAVLAQAQERAALEQRFKGVTPVIKLQDPRSVGQIDFVAAEGGHAAVLYWVQPTLKPGAAEAVVTLSTGHAKEDGFRYEDTPAGRDLFFLKQPVHRHVNIPHDPARHVETYKHFHHLFGLHGEGPITKGPGGQFTHHRGLYIGWSKTRHAGKTYDFWHCKTPETFIQHDQYLKESEALGPVFARTASLAHWRQGESVIVRERRELTAWKPSAAGYTLDIEFTLEAVEGDVELDGDPQHAGFQLRAHESVEKSNATYTRPAGATGGKGDVWDNTRWVAASFKIADKPYELAHMNHPDNPACVYSTRNYGRFGSYFKHTLKAGQPLRLRYRVVLADPRATKPDWVAAFAQYIEPLRGAAAVK